MYKATTSIYLFSAGVANHTCQIIGKWHAAKDWQIPDLMIVSYSKLNITFHSWNITKANIQNDYLLPQ